MTEEEEARWMRKKSSGIPSSAMDRYIDNVPAHTEGSGARYDGRVWYKHLSTLKSVNSVPVDLLKPLEKSDLKHGDKVKV